MIVWALWLIAIQNGGALAVRLLQRNSSSSASASWVIDFSAGFVLFAILQLFMGAAGFARLPLIYPAFALGAMACFRAEVRHKVLDMPGAVIWQFRQLTPRHVTLVAVFLLLVTLLVVPALTPPAQSDGLRYHLGAVQEYLKLGSITYIPLNAYSNMPFLVEMHFMAALACNAPEASQLMHLTLALYTALGIYALVVQISPAVVPAGKARLFYLLPALLYIATPMSAVLGTWPFTDHGIAFFLVVSVLVSFSTTSRWRDWALLGLVTGGLIGTKYTVAPVAVAIMAVPGLRGGNWNYSRVTGTLTGLAVMGVIGGTWYLKNLLLTGNPFYPLGSRLFPGGEWSAINDSFLQARAGAKGMGKGLLQMVKLPWNSTFSWIRFESHHPGATVLIASIAAVGGLATTGNKHLDRDRRLLFVLILLSFIIWFFSYQSNRLLLPTLALCLSMMPLFLFGTSSFSKRLYAGAMAVASAAGLLWAIQWSWLATALTPPPLPYLTGAQDQRAYWYKSVTYGRAYDLLNSRVKKSERVLLVGEHRIYGAQFNAIWSDWFDTPALVHLLRENSIRSIEQLLDFLRSRNINWIMINEAELAPQLERDFRSWFTPQEWQIFEALRSLESPGIQVYELPPGITILHLRVTD
jgi:hypothetical protein